MLKLAKIDSIQKKVNQYSYASTDPIGKGFSSQVYKGRNEQTDEQVAIKMIDMKTIKGNVHKNLLANQIQILRLLRSVPNILQFYEVFNIRNSTCIITQLCQGGDLSKLLKTKKTLFQPQALAILKQVINGYRGIYRFGIIHRDLKPANIFFVNGKVKIADFGFAIKQSNIKNQCSYNVGSPVYMPLQALNQNMYSFKSDIWAIGVIFYEMLTGKTPWRAKTQSDLKRQIKTNPIKTILPPNISDQSIQFLSRTLQSNPVLRMSPQQLQRFFSNNQLAHQAQIHMERSQRDDTLFMTQKRPAQNFRTRALSNEKYDRVPKNETQYDKYTVNVDITMKTERKKAFIKGIGETGVDFDSLVRTAATLRKKTQTNFIPCDSKKQFQCLISQVHFCRFLFKLIDRIKKSFNIDTHRKVRIKITAMIFQKLKDVSQLKGLQLRGIQHFKQSTQYGKLLNIVGQYQQKYQQSLKQFIPQIDNLSGQQGLTQFITKQIQSLYYFIESIDNSQQMTEQVILLDYLITCKQLLNIQSNSTLGQFHSKAKIQAIVNGKPTKNITNVHIRAIKDKLKSMKII